MIKIEYTITKQFMKDAQVDPAVCIGCGLCVQLCPKVFAMQDDGKSKAVNPKGDDDEGSEKCIQGAIDACPVTAISWAEEGEEKAA